MNDVAAKRRQNLDLEDEVTGLAQFPEDGMMSPARRGKSDLEAPRAVQDVEAAIVQLVRTVRIPRVARSLGAEAGGLDRTEHQVLKRLELSGPQRLSALAAELSLDVSTLSRHVAQAERRDLITRKPDESDGRAALLSLTEKGARTLAKVRRLRLEALSEALSDWTEEELERFATQLERCALDLDRHAQDHQ